MSLHDSPELISGDAQSFPGNSLDLVVGRDKLPQFEDGFKLPYIYAPWKAVSHIGKSYS